MTGRSLFVHGVSFFIHHLHTPPCESGGISVLRPLRNQNCARWGGTRRDARSRRVSAPPPALHGQSRRSDTSCLRRSRVVCVCVCSVASRFARPLARSRPARASRGWPERGREL